MSETVIDDKGRPEPSMEANEIDTLVGFLDYQRATLDWKTRGLGDDELRAPLHPTSMTLGGLLKHMAAVEDFWFANVAGEGPMPEPWASQPMRDDWEWTSASQDSAETLRRLWNERVTSSREVLGRLLQEGPEKALATTHPAWGGQAQVSLRWILVHMVEEYARHNGHADLLRESIDGETGE